MNKLYVYFCPSCEKDKGYESKGSVVQVCLKCGSHIHYTIIRKVER